MGVWNGLKTRTFIVDQLDYRYMLLLFNTISHFSNLLLTLCTTHIRESLLVSPDVLIAFVELAN